MIPRYQSSLLKKIWSDENKYAVWFKVERHYLKAYLHAHNKHDEALLARLDKAALAMDWTQFVARVARYDEEVKHDVIAFLHALEDELGDDARLIHIGLTSSDIVDTAFAYLLKEANQEILPKLALVIKALWEKACAYKGVLCLGRTHGQAAEPMTLGLKFLSHACELARGYSRLSHAADELAVGKLSGAVGVYALTSPAIETETLSSLGLTGETVATQVVARDRHANYFSALAVLAGSIERFSTEIRLLMHGQVQEVFEPFSAKQKGSSAMPHKKNPILSENLCGLMRMVRSYSLSAMENQALWHERDISHSSVERIIAPDATSIMDFALTRMHGLVSNLVVDTDRLAKNLDDAGAVLKSQAILLALIEAGQSRQSAYELVQNAAQNNSGRSFRESLDAVGITAILGAVTCEDLLAGLSYTKHESESFDRAAAALGDLVA